MKFPCLIKQKLSIAVGALSYYLVVGAQVVCACAEIASTRDPFRADMKKRQLLGTSILTLAYNASEPVPEK